MVTVLSCKPPRLGAAVNPFADFHKTLVIHSFGPQIQISGLLCLQPSKHLHKQLHIS